MYANFVICSFYFKYLCGLEVLNIELSFHYLLNNFMNLVIIDDICLFFLKKRYGHEENV